MNAVMIGRDAELAALAPSIAHPTTAGATAHFIVGEPGIGKTALLDAALAMARDSGRRVMVARPSESERDLAFAGLSDLLAGHVAYLRPRLAPPLRRALEIALLLRDPEGEPVDPRAIGSATRSSLEDLASDGPVVIGIDDVQWLDRPTVDALAFALRRSRLLPINLIATIRASPGAPAASVALPLAESLAAGAVSSTELRGVSVGALGRILGDRLQTPIPRHALLRLHGASAGNPLLAVEMARAMIERTGGLVALDQPVLSRNLEQLVGDRLERLPTATQRLLILVAARSNPTVGDLSVVAGASARRFLQPAVDAGVVAIAGARIRFTHPLYAAAAYGRATDAARVTGHRLLARNIVEPIERARHEAMATRTPSQRAASIIELGAEAARQRGGIGVAAELMGHARRLTPHAREPEARRRAVAEAMLRWTAGEPAQARSVVEEALADLPPGRLRSEAWLLLAVAVEWMDSRAAAERVLRMALGEHPTDPDIEAALRLRCALATPRPAAIVRQTGLAVARLAPMADRYRDLVAAALLIRAEACLRLGHSWREDDVRTAHALLAAHRGRPASLAIFPAEEIALERAWILGTLRDELAQARTTIGQIQDRLEQLGWDRSRAIVLADLSVLESWMGDLDTAGVHARHSLELADGTGATPYARASALGALGLVAACRGDVDAGRSAIAQAFLARPPAEDRWQAARALATLGFLELVAGRPRDALLALDQVADIVRAVGDREPADLRFEGDHLEAAMAMGRRDTAAMILADLERRRRIADRPWLVVMVARGRALMAAADGKVHAALEELNAASDAHASLQMPLERGRTLLLEGRLRRRLRQKLAAREVFERAAELFVASGADGLAAAAHAEAARVGIRSASPLDLTETERRVAESAARGMTNRAVSEMLFLSPKSVDGVLLRVYQKLGIHSRAELGALLGGASEPNSPDHPPR